MWNDVIKYVNLDGKWYNMDYCKDCQYYEDRDSYPNKGWCDMHLTYVKDNDTCEDFEEEEE